MFLFALLVFIISMGVLAVLALRISLECLCITVARFHKVRMGLAIFVVAYAAYCVWRLTENVAIPREIDKDFVPELITISMFWVLAPPVWFFVEFFGIANNCIDGFSPEEKNLKITKDYADYASKIWAGVLALLLALIALKK
jgi:hypothetical protein